MVQQQPTTNYIKLNHDEIEYNPNLNQIPIIPDNNNNHNKNETQHYGSYYNPNTILNNNFNNNSHLNEQQISVVNDNNYIPPNLNNLQNLQNNGGNNYNNNNYMNNNHTNYGPTNNNNFNTKNIQVQQQQQQPSSFYYQPTTTTSTPHVTHNITTLQQANHVTTNTTNTNANTNANTTLHIITHYDQDFHKKKNDDQAMLLFIFGFFIPICWIFLFFMTRNELKYSKKGKIYGTIGCIFWLIFLFITISFIILIIVLKFL